MDLTDYRQLLPFSDEEFRRADPLVMNLLVARSIPSLAHLEIPRYAALRDEWAEAIKARLAKVELFFWREQGRWRYDVNFFRLGVLCEYLDCELRIAYKEDQRNVTSVYYTNPSDLFLNGVMDTRRGTCGNMAALHVALGWRLGWPVSLACVRGHFICRYDDGKVRYNIEATQAERGGFKSDSDRDLIEENNLPPVAVSSGSDLRALTPREMLGTFLSCRARHMRDTGRRQESEVDYLLARWLFPTSRKIYIDGMATAVARGPTLFEPGEVGSPQSLAAWVANEYGMPLRTPPPGGTVIREYIHVR
jgi:hypothetical protein